MAKFNKYFASIIFKWRSGYFSIVITAADAEIVSDALKIEKGPREVIHRFQNQTFLD